MTNERLHRNATAGVVTRDGGSLVACDPAHIPLGAHLVTSRRGYRHHGIHAGAGRVIHYAGFARSWRAGPVEDVTLERFAAGRPVFIDGSGDARFGAADVVARARSRLGEDRYRLATNNCEHFCEWCLNGRSRSAQVEHVLDWAPLAALRRLVHHARAIMPARTARAADSCIA